MEKPSLTEPGVKFFMSKVLKHCSEQKHVFSNLVFNIILFLGERIRNLVRSSISVCRWIGHTFDTANLHPWGQEHFQKNQSHFFYQLCLFSECCFELLSNIQIC